MSNFLRKPDDISSPINATKFSHGLLFSDRKKNSTYNSIYLSTSPNPDSTFQSNSKSHSKSNSKSTSQSTSQSTSKYSNKNSNVLSPIDSVNFNKNLLNSKNKNSTIKKSIYYHNPQYSNLSDYNKLSSRFSSNCSKKRNQNSESTDLNNNEELSSDDDGEIRMSYSYMKNCAIYGIPSKDRIESYDQLIDWWIYSICYDLKWFIGTNLKKIIILTFLFILFNIACIMFYD